jgi:hypothetical protein
VHEKAKKRKSEKAKKRKSEKEKKSPKNVGPRLVVLRAKNRLS